MNNLVKNCYSTALKCIATVFILSVLIWPVSVNAGFVTGLIVGSMLSSQEDRNIIHEMGQSVSYDEQLYTEYKRNKELMHQVKSAQRIQLELRNHQIEKKLIDQAKEQYISGFSIKLIPIEQKILEKITISKNSFMDQIYIKIFSTGHKNSSKPIEAMRKQILYKLKFTKESSRPITEFDVLSINNHPPIKKNGEYYFYYNEHWRNNFITVNVRNKNHPSLDFELNHHYYVDSPKQLQQAVKDSEDVTFLERLFMLMSLLFLSLGIMKAYS